MIYYANSHKGNVRQTNEDAIYIPDDDRGFFAVVADGLGGHCAGEVASGIVIESVCEVLGAVKPQETSAQVINKALCHANSRVWQSAKNDPSKRGMGSTATIAAFVKGQALIGNVGDSRAYHFCDGHMTQVTKDHSYVQILVDRGYITKEDALRHPQKNVITRAIGTETDIEVDIFTVALHTGDAVLLCSDGLNNTVPDEEILRIMQKDISSAADRLIEAALEGGGTDNVSVVIAVNNGGAV